MTIAPQGVRTETGRTPTTGKPALKWTLVQAAPGALVFAAPGLPSRHPLVRRARTAGQWTPAGSIGVTHAGKTEPVGAHYAEFIGRVGLLAAALGVGAAVVGQPGVALAEPTDTDAGTASISASESAPAESDATESPAARTKSDTTDDSGQSEASTASDSSAEAGTAVDQDAQSSTTGSDTTAATASEQESTESTESAEVVEQAAEQPATEPATGAEETSSTEIPTAPQDLSTPAQSTSAPMRDPSAATSTVTPDRPVLAAPSSPSDTATDPAPLRVMRSTAEADGTSAAQTVTPLRATSTPAIATSADDQAPAPATPSVVDQVIDTVLAPLASPSSTPAAQAAQTSVLWGVLAWVRHTFFNQTPTLSYDPSGNTRVDDTITGRIVATDTDSPTLTFTVVDNPEHGTVSVAADGHFTYTVTDPGYIDNGGLDSFTVTVSDATDDVHLHSLGGLLNLVTFGLIGDSGHTATLTVTPVNAAPIPGDPAYTLGGAEHSKGAVEGALDVTDPDHDTLVYTVTGGPADGAVLLRPDGTFTYTPTPEARHDAAAEQNPLVTDNFTVTVDDTHGHTLAVPVTVDIDPSNTAPIMTMVVSDPDTDGTVHVSVLTTDADIDPVTYLVVHDPASGTLTSTADGYLYTPSQAARRTAADTPGIDTDTFELRVSDSHHGTDTETATVVISPSESSVVATIGVGWKPTQVAVSPDGTHAYITNLASNSVSVIDTDTNTVTATVRVGWRPTAVTVSPDSTHAYVTNLASNSVSVIDTETNTATATVRVGWRPTAVTVSPDSTHAYVTNAWGRSVSVIDTDTNTVTATIGVGWRPTAVTVSPDGTHAYVTNAGSNTVSVIDTATNSVTATIRVGWKPTAVTVSPDSSRVYVTDTASGSVSVIDADTNIVIDTIRVGNGPIAVAVVVGPGGTLPIVTPPTPPSAPDPTTNAVTGFLGVVDPDGDPLTFTVTGAPAYGTVTVDSAGTYTYIPNQAGRIRAGLGLGNEDSFTVTVTQPATTTGNAQIYVVNANSNTVSVIGATPAPTARALTAAAAPAALAEEGFSQPVTIDGIQIAPNQFVADDPITVPGHPYGVTFTPDGTRAYVVNGYAVSVIDTADNTVIGGPINVGVQPTRVAFSPDGKRAYVTNSGSDTVSVINTDPDSGDAYNTVVTTIGLPSGSGPIAPAVSSDDSPFGSRVYVANYYNSTVSVIDADTVTDTYEVIGAAIPVGPGPQGVAVSPDGTHVYVAATGGGSGGPMTIIDTTTATPTVSQITVGLGSFGVAFSPDGNRLYVTSGTSFADPFVAVVDTAPPGSPAHNPDTYNTPIDYIDLGDLTFAAEVAVSPDGSLIYVTHPFAGTMSVIIPTTHEVLTSLDVVSAPLVVAVHPGGSLIYVANGDQQGHTVSVISIAPPTTP